MPREYDIPTVGKFSYLIEHWGMCLRNYSYPQTVMALRLISEHESMDVKSLKKEMQKVGVSVNNLSTFLSFLNEKKHMRPPTQLQFNKN